MSEFDEGEPLWLLSGILGMITIILIILRFLCDFPWEFVQHLFMLVGVFVCFSSVVFVIGGIVSIFTGPKKDLNYEERLWEEATRQIKWREKRKKLWSLMKNLLRRKQKGINNSERGKHET
jgi:hypothetical protein